LRDDSGMTGRSSRIYLATVLLAGLAVAGGGAQAEAPRRIVSFNVCADQLVLALADPQQIVALSPYAADASISVVAEQAKAFRRVPLQAESVIPLDPDLVLVAPSFRVVTQPILKALGFNVVEVGLINDLAAGRAQIREFAALFGHSERGEALIADIDAARDRLAAARGERAATALLIANGGYTVGPDSLAASLLDDAGLVPPPGAPKGFGGIVPLEKLIALRPDYLVMSSLVEEANGQGALYLTHPALQALYPPARRIILPARYTICGGPSLVAGLDYLTGIVTRLAEDRPVPAAPPMH
jgi:iron complex transport system substrate-binding protein